VLGIFPVIDRLHSIEADLCCLGINAVLPQHASYLFRSSRNLVISCAGTILLRRNVEVKKSSIRHSFKLAVGPGKNCVHLNGGCWWILGACQHRQERNEHGKQRFHDQPLRDTNTHMHGEVRGEASRDLRTMFQERALDQILIALIAFQNR